MRYRPDLDGIRALAVLAVMASHTGIALTLGGWLGVDVFFVLSGYLITTLLLGEWARTNTVSLRRFYLRRVLRLYPALLLVLVAGAFFYRELGAGGTLAGYGRTALVSGLYLEDIFEGFGHAVGLLGHTWSLAVEEQFYLLWPPVLLLLCRRRADPLRWAVAGTLLGWGCGVVYALQSSQGAQSQAYFVPWCRASAILVGCVLALLIGRGVEAPRILRRFSGGVAGGLGLAALVVMAELGRSDHVFWSLRRAWEAPLCAVLVAALLWHLAAAPASPLRRLLGVAPLAWMGRRSYGIYLIHLPVLDILATHLHARRAEVSVLMVAVTVVLAALSYRFVELPLLRLKRRFHVPQRPDASGEASVSATA